MSDLDRAYWVNVGPHGTFRPIGNFSTEPKDIDGIFDRLAATGAKKLLLYFHGGLVSEEKGYETAVKIHGLFDGIAHPVTFIWETGLLETIRAELEELDRRRLFRRVLRYGIRHVARLLGGGLPDPAEVKAAMKSPTDFDRWDGRARRAAEALGQDQVDELRIRAELKARIDRDGKLVKWLRKERHRKPGVPALDPPRRKAQVAEGVAKVVVRVIRRLQVGRDHGLYPTVVEETLRVLYLDLLGQWFYRGIADAAREMFDPNPGKITLDSHPGTYFLDRLRAHLVKHPDLVVDVAGHSAGSIALSHLLREAAGKKVPIRKVVFLAPAVRCDLFHREIARHPERCHDFRMFTMHDDYEVADHLIPGVYTRSLLYFVSGVLEEEVDQPLTGMHRHVRGIAPYDTPELRAVHDFLADPEARRTVLSVTTAHKTGQNSEATSHGDFDDDPATQGSMQSIVGS